MVGFRKKGSLTVEAVFVVPICLLVCFLLLQALFYLHHVSWYTAAAWECVLTGLTEGEKEDAVRKRWQELKQEQVLPVGQLKAGTSSGSQSAEIEIRGSMSPLAGLSAMDFTVTVKRNALAPASFLRKAKGVKALVKGQG